MCVFSFFLLSKNSQKATFPSLTFCQVVQSFAWTPNCVYRCLQGSIILSSHLNNTSSYKLPISKLHTKTVLRILLSFMQTWPLQGKSMFENCCFNIVALTLLEHFYIAEIQSPANSQYPAQALLMNRLQLLQVTVIDNLYFIFTQLTMLKQKHGMPRS